jgi:hypothetical protein
MATPTPTALITLGGVVLCWIVFAGIFFLRKRPESVQEAKRDKAAGMGVALQMCAYAVAWFQPPRSPFCLHGPRWRAAQESSLGPVRWQLP